MYRLSQAMKDMNCTWVW